MNYGFGLDCSSHGDCKASREYNCAVAVHVGKVGRVVQLED